MKRLAAIALALGVASSAASAASTGCYVGGTIGASMFNTATNISNALEVDGFGSDGFFGGALLGCDLKLPAGFVIGGFANYDWLNNETTLTSKFFPGNVADLSYENEWALGIRGGFNITDKTMLYGLVAYNELQPSDLNILGKSFDVGSFSGYAVGGGLQVDLSNHIELGLEYRHHMYDEQSVQINKWTAIEFDPTHDTVRAVLTYHLGTQEAIEELKQQPLK